jgi:hypothetical protein
VLQETAFRVEPRHSGHGGEHQQEEARSRPQPSARLEMTMMRFTVHDELDCDLKNPAKFDAALRDAERSRLPRVHEPGNGKARTVAHSDPLGLRDRRELEARMNEDDF